MPAVMPPATVPLAAAASLTVLSDGWGPWLFVGMSCVSDVSIFDIQP